MAAPETVHQTPALLGLRSDPGSDLWDLLSFSTFPSFLTSFPLTHALPLPLSSPKGWGRSVAEGISLSQRQT